LLTLIYCDSLTMTFLKAALALLCVSSTVQALNSALGVRKTFREYTKQIAELEATGLQSRDLDPSLLYPEHNFSTPVDHFHNESKYAPHSDDFFPMRYWFDASHYKPGGPVIILQSGETSAVGRLVFMQKGILAQLAEATNGIAVVLEHRYYGASFPTSTLSTENLRFLTTQQALADEAYFATHVQFPGLEHYGDLTSNTTAYFSYGGSYPGAFSAFLRVQYPDIFYGSISSSGVTKAIYDYWQYFEPIAEGGPQNCIAAQRKLTNVVDNILIGKNESTLTAQLKSVYGLANITHNTDFVNVLAMGIYNWQELNWDPAVSDPEFYNYCDNITASQVLYPATETLKPIVTSLLADGGYGEDDSLVIAMLNQIGYTNLTQVAPCAEDGTTQDTCFSSYNYSYYQQDSLSAYPIRSWAYQYCTEWGFLQTGDVPADQLPLVSRLLDLEYESIVCRAGFNITTAPDTEAVNKYGGYDISYPRLAIIDGEFDPWRPATPHAFGHGAKDRVSTTSEPFILIQGGVHHWDENGLFPNETTPTLPPAPIADTQRAEVRFVKAWMREWHRQHHGKGSGGPGWGYAWPFLRNQ